MFAKEVIKKSIQYHLTEEEVQTLNDAKVIVNNVLHILSDIHSDVVTFDNWFTEWSEEEFATASDILNVIANNREFEPCECEEGGEDECE